MSGVLKIRGGTTAEHATFTGEAREITVDTTKNTVVVHDGATAGGFPLAKREELTATNTSFDNTASGLAATNVQELGDELAAEKLDATGGTATGLTVNGITSGGSIQEQVSIGNAGSSFTINLNNGTLYRRNLNSAHCDFVLPDPAAWPGASFTLAVRLGANGRTYAFTGGAVVWDENGQPDASTQSGRTDLYVFTSINGYWLAAVVGIGYQAG